VRLAQHYAGSETPQLLLPLVAESEDYFRQRGNEVAAGTFFNEVARLADRPLLKELRDELRDRALLGLAGKLRQRAAVEYRPGTLVSDLLGQHPTWAPALVRDADFAVKAATKRVRSAEVPASAEALVSYATVRTGLVTAACFAPLSGDVFVGFRSGGISCFRPRQGEVIRLPDNGLPVLSLAASDDGEYLATLHSREPGVAHLFVYESRNAVGYRKREDDFVPYQGQPWLAPRWVNSVGDEHFALWNGIELRYFGLRSWGAGPKAMPSPEVSYVGAVFLPRMDRSHSENILSTFSVLLFSADEARYYSHASSSPHSFSLGWTPSLPPDSSLHSPTLAWQLTGPDYLELAGLGPTGTLYWSTLKIGRERVEIVGTRASTGEEGYLAGTIVQSRLVAGVTRSTIHWLFPATGGLVARSTTRVALPGAVACFPSHATHELIVVCRDGQLARVPVPK
jgi:hypothetical protein